MLQHLLTLLLLSNTAVSVPAPAPEAPGADGQCEKPTIYVETVTKLPKDGPHLVTGARADANQNGGGASFTKSYMVSTAYTITAGLDLDGDFDAIKALSIGIDASFSVTQTKGSSVGVNTICPSNTKENDTITWGLVDYLYNYQVTGQKFYPQGYDPMMRGCLSGYVADDRKGGNHSYTNVYPASQAGSQDGADFEVEFQCCTDSDGNPYPGSPVCPDAS